MSKRPFKSHSIDALISEVNWNSEDANMLRKLIAEMRLRKKSRSIKKLLSHILSAQSQINTIEANSSEESSKQNENFVKDTYSKIQKSDFETKDPLDALNLSNYYVRVLRGAGIGKIEDLTELTASDFIKLPKITNNLMLHVSRSLKSHGLCFVPIKNKKESPKPRPLKKT